VTAIALGVLALNFFDGLGLCFSFRHGLGASA
jgi:hypothetical protein